MSDDRHRWPKLADEGLRLLLRLVLNTALILIVFPHLPGVRFSGSVLVALMLAVPFAVLGRLGHSSVEVASANPETGGTWSQSANFQKLTARPWGWIVVAAVWAFFLLAVPSFLLHLFALVPNTHMEFSGWWSALLPTVLFFLVHFLAVSIASRPERRGSPARDIP